MTCRRPASARRRTTAIAACLAVVLTLAACSDSEKPYLVVEGGGFIFNYRIAEAFYGVSLRPLRKLEPGTVIEAAFENPAGGAPLVERHTVRGNELSFMLRTPAVSGVRAGRDYTVEIRVHKPGSEDVLATYSKAFRSNVDQTVMPNAPLTIGPGYTPNPQ